MATASYVQLSVGERGKVIVEIVEQDYVVRTLRMAAGSIVRDLRPWAQFVIYYPAGVAAIEPVLRALLAAGYTVQPYWDGGAELNSRSVGDRLR